jgi:hypothetical protein
MELTTDGLFNLSYDSSEIFSDIAIEGASIGFRAKTDEEYGEQVINDVFFTPFLGEGTQWNKCKGDTSIDIDPSGKLETSRWKQKQSGKTRWFFQSIRSQSRWLQSHLGKTAWRTPPDIEFRRRNKPSPTAGCPWSTRPAGSS